MGLPLRKQIEIETKHLTLRPPQNSNYDQWVQLRGESQSFLTQWEPSWHDNHLTRKAFGNRIRWVKKSVAAKTAIPLFIFRHTDEVLVGAITLDNIRRGPSQSGILGYWIGEKYARKGYMGEALPALTHYAFTQIDLSRLEAACLPENKASRRVLERSGFKYEGVAQSYLQINGRWRTHVLYAALRHDRRGVTDAGF